MFEEKQQFELLHLFEFDSNRKRMSIIVKSNENKIKLFIKGADNVIKARLDHKIPQIFLNKINYNLDYFSKLGLRTLCIATREISIAEYEKILDKWNSLVDCANRSEKIRK